MTKSEVIAKETIRETMLKNTARLDEYNKIISSNLDKITEILKQIEETE